MARLVAPLLLCLLSLAAADNCDTHGNGCSIPGGLNYFYKSLFTKACNRHDICYGCGAKLGVSRSTCDSKFKTNMQSACNTLSKLADRTWCRMVVNDYYLAVRGFGGSHYKSASNPDSYCSQSWVRSCI